MKVVVFGCQQIAVDFITFLKSKRDIDISLIVTYELPLDKTYGYKSVHEKFSSTKTEVLNRKNSKIPTRLNYLTTHQSCLRSR